MLPTIHISNPSSLSSITAWFIAVQTLQTFAIVFGFLGLAVYPMAAVEQDKLTKQNIATWISAFSSKYNSCLCT